MRRLVSAWRFAILFLAGFHGALPEYGWARPWQVAHGVFVDDALLLAYLAAVFFTVRSHVIRVGAKAVWFALLIVGLGAVGVLSASLHPYSVRDYGEAARLLVYAALFLCVVRWAETLGREVVLRAFVTGAALGTMINLFYTITDPPYTIGLLPVLHSQNGAGGHIALCIVLAAWLAFIGRRRYDSVSAGVMTLLGIVAVAMSFSKTAMTITVCGLIAWMFVLGLSLITRHARRSALVTVAMLAIGGVYVARSDAARERVDWAITLVGVKFTGLDVNNKYSLGARYMYFFGVAEVVSANPLTGVSYSGFYDAITSTDAYATGQMADEDPESGRNGESNPHNSFLYYAAANGVPGLLLASSLFGLFVTALIGMLARYPGPGVPIAACISLAYLIYGMTLPTLFDTKVLYVPAAVALARRNIQRSVSEPEAM